MSADPIQRGRRWKAFYDEDGGLKDMLATIRQTYLERMAEVPVGDLDRLQTMQLAHRVSREFEGMVLAIVNSAEVAAAAQEYQTRMMAIPEAKRRYL